MASQNTQGTSAPESGSDTKWKKSVLDNPDMILSDPKIMRALISANDKAETDNVVDLRSLAMDRMEARLDRLEETHRSVVAAAYENLAGTNQIHRAILRMLEPIEFEQFLHDLGGEVADILRVDQMRLVLETKQSHDEPAVNRLSDILSVTDPGFVHVYMNGSPCNHNRQATLRQISPEEHPIFDDESCPIHSEAALRLDFGPGRLPGMLLMGSEDPHHFRPDQGTDLLRFFASVFERTMRRWLG